jgi:hypothetical protein
MAKKAPQVLRLKITLEHVDPAPWREIEIRSDKTLPHLHDAIQAAFLWNDLHLWDFEIGARKYQMKSEEFWIEPMFVPTVMEVTTKRLDYFLNSKVPLVVYTYDFGDDWTHRIELISKRPIEPNGPCHVLSAVSGRPRQRISEARRCTRSSRKRVKTQATQNTIGRRKQGMLTGAMMKSTPMLSASSSRNCKDRKRGGHHVGFWMARWIILGIPLVTCAVNTGTHKFRVHVGLISR